MVLKSVMHWTSPVPPPPHVGVSSGTIIALCAVLSIAGALLVWAMRWAWRIGRGTWQFLDDWNGEKPRPGVHPRPGVMERLGSVEDMVGAVKEQMSLNGGTSMHDVVVATAKDVVQVKEDLTKLSGRVELFERQREQRDG